MRHAIVTWDAMNDTRKGVATHTHYEMATQDLRFHSTSA